MLKSRGSLPWTVQRYPKAKIAQIVFQKCKSLSKKCKSNHPSASNLTSQSGDQWAMDAYRAGIEVQERQL